jgi:hypothetical protein
MRLMQYLPVAQEITPSRAQLATLYALQKCVIFGVICIRHFAL